MWDGTERRKAEREFCSGHVKLAENISWMRATLDAVDKRINGSIDSITEHIKESDRFRIMITEHERILKDICSLRRFWYGALFTIIGGIISVAILWGGLNTKMDRLEKLYPIGKVMISNDSEKK